MFVPLISSVQIDVQELMEFVDSDSISQVRNNLNGLKRLKQINTNHHQCKCFLNRNWCCFKSEIFDNLSVNEKNNLQIVQFLNYSWQVDSPQYWFIQRLFFDKKDAKHSSLVKLAQLNFWKYNLIGLSIFIHFGKQIVRPKTEMWIRMFCL